MGRIEPSREAVDEVPARARRAVDDLEVLPAERDHPRPLDGLAGVLPAIVLTLGERAAHDAAAGRAVTSHQLARDRASLDTPARHLGQPRRPEGAAGDEHSEGLEEVRFALRVGADQEVQPWRRTVLQGAVITEVDDVDPADLHP